MRHSLLLFRNMIKSPDFRRRIGLLILAAGIFFVSIMASAQMIEANAQWQHLKALPSGSHLHVSADHGGATCTLVTVDDATLLCGKRDFARADVKQIKLTRYGTSYLAGAAIGAGVGAGVGVGLSGVTDDGFFKNNKGTFAGGGAVVGALVGLLVTGPADLFRGPTIYRR